jgi:PAS domain S-box-containing protein
VTLNVAEGLLLVAIGACSYLAALRLWIRPRDLGPSRWASLWAIAAVVFSSARFAQLTAPEPGPALLAARVAAASTPFLLWSLYRLVDSLVERPARPLEFAIVRGVAIASSAAMLFTPWFVLPEAVQGVDLAGEPFWKPRHGAGMWLAALEAGVAIAWCLRELVRARGLPAPERRLCLVALTLYAGMGVSSLLPAFGFDTSEGLLEYGPLVVSMATSRLLAHRQRRLEGDLQSLIAQRAGALRESEARYRGVIEHAPVGFLSIDASGQLEHANAGLLAMLGSTRAQFEGAFNVANEENAKRSGFSAMLERALETGEVLSSEFEFDTWWGRRLTTHTTVAPHRDASGTVIGALAIVEDITERRALAQRLQRAQHVEAVGQLAAGIAHEINNPMAYVRSNLSVLGEELAALAKAVPAGDAAGRIARLEALRTNSLASVQRTVSIVRDLREFSRASHAERETVDVNALLEHAARLASSHCSGLGEIALELGAVPHVAIDSDQLRQVLLHLLTHAQQAAGPRGHVRAATTRAVSDVLISIHDDGPPVRPEERERLFDPFASSRGEHGEPTLGLYVSNQIVREHEGRIEVLSSESHGTTFVVRLPAVSEAV